MGMRLSAICEVVDKHVCQVAVPVPVGLATLDTWSGDVHVQPEGGEACCRYTRPGLTGTAGVRPGL